MAQSTSWVKGGTSGRLVYGLDDAGDRIGDFSRAGYLGGDAALPNSTALGLPVINVSPVSGGGDSLAAIQAAIDAAANTANYPMRPSGYRAIVQLSAGQFNVSDTIKIHNTSGILFRGVGDSNTTGTRLAYTGSEQIQMITVGATLSGGGQVVRAGVANSSTNVRFDSKIIPSGSYALPLTDVSKYSVGDKILVERPSPLNWLEDIGMRALDNPWGPGNYDQDYERVITAIDRKTNSVMLDAPIPNALQAQYGGAKVSKYTFARTNNIGIENIYADGQLGGVNNGTNENHANSFVQINSAENVFVRNVTAVHQVYAAVEAGKNSKHVTVDDALFTNPTSQITGGRRYSFNQEGQYGLMQNVRSDRSRHDFVNNSPSRGPNVFLDAVATRSYDDSGPHQRWSTGSLFDNVDHQGGNGLNIRNRTNSGSGHGWTGSGMVVWNSQADAGFNVENPQTAQNWIIGSTGPYDSSSRPGYSASKNVAVTLSVGGENFTSLYRAQLADRIAYPGETVREYTVGDYDGYTTGDAADAPYVDPAWRAAAVARKPTVALRGFDDRTPKGNIPFTFAFDLNPAVEHVTSAVLSISLDPTATSSGAGTQIFADTTAASFDYVDDFGAKPRFTTETGVSVDILTIEFTDGGYFDLAKLQDGQLNMLVFDNHAIDWANLVITVAPGAVPEPTSLAAVALAAAALLRRRR